MATTGTQDELRLSPAIPHVLDRLRRRIRGYVWLEGTTSAVAWLGLAFWLSLALDWFFEPSRPVRGVALGLAGLVLLVLVFRLILRRITVRLTDGNMAMLLERRFPELNESLLTTVEVATRGDKARQFNRQMLAHTCHEAEQRVGEVRVRRVFNPSPLVRSATAAVMLAASVALFAVLLPGAFGTWANRALGFSNELWPRRTILTVKDFEKGYVKVACGSDLEVVARADLAGELVPNTVDVRYRSDEGARGSATMNRVGHAERGKDKFQEYTYKFQGVLSPIRFDLHGGDMWIEGLRIVVVDNPTLLPLVLEYEYPKYTNLTPKSVTVDGVMQVPKGTKVTVVARANKDLVRVRIDSALEPKKSPETIELAGSKDLRGFRYTIPSLEKDTALLFTLLDADGIKTREPVRLALAAVPDEPPQLEVRLRGIGPAVTPQARIPAAGTIKDDFGLAKVWFEYAIDKEKAREAAIATMADSPAEHALDAALEAHDLGIKPGQKLTLDVKAADGCALGSGANVGTSERWLLDVVTPEQLRLMLEKRELVLRQRFEVIIREVEDTQKLLEKIEFAASPSGAGGDNGKDGKKEGKKDGKPGDKPPAGAEPGDKPPAGAEPGDKSGPGTEASAKQIRNRALMAAQRASQNASKNRQEILGVAEAIDDIREELINNRIDSDKLRSRLKHGIADPLRVVGQEMFPRLEQRLAELEATIANPETGPRARLKAVQQIDLILVQLRHVLNEMLKMETYQELIAQLRAIIEAQTKLNEATKKRNEDQLKKLLE